ncbi:MAG: hypothetical protein QHH74_10475 [Spirochaetota bacterium]|nr:hypothetical protein [Spirochaetota bacterium]
MNKLLCEAIKSKKIIRFYYEGYERIVEPHAYGIHKDTENEVLRAYQIGGYSSSGKIPVWRLYVVSKMINIIITDDSFEHPRPDYKMNDSMMSKIFCQIN